MKVLGVGFGHDGSACLVEDGKVVRYIAEERFSRLKCGMGNILKSVKFCLGDCKMSDIDKIVASDGLVGTVKYHSEMLLNYSKGDSFYPRYFDGKCYDVGYFKQIDHHLCHASSAYFTSGFKDSLIITYDGIGVDTTQTVSVADGKSIKFLELVKGGSACLRGKDGVFKERRYIGFTPNRAYSWGWFYGMITDALGWRMVTDEGKTMGLAPYGDSSKVPRSEVMEHMTKRYPEGFIIDDGKFYYTFGGSIAYSEMVKKYGRENMAAAAQDLLEHKVVTFVKKWVKRTGRNNLCVAGGVFLNVKLNQKIKEALPDINFWPFPIASDSGLSIGAALYEYHMSCDTFKPERINDIYWGSQYGDDEIESVLKRNKIHYGLYDVNEVAQALADNKIVAWFNGRMEGGPRALGGRSILMSPLKAENKDIINKTVKFREGFRPFCPSVTIEAADRYFDGGGEYMIQACNVKTKDIPAVTHIDGTARPQFVRREANPKFHELLTRFGEITGHPVLLNTSFNVMGEPIIESPEQAIRCFYGVGIDMLVIGKFVVKKHEGVTGK